MYRKLVERYITTATKIEFPMIVLGSGVGAVSMAFWSIKEPQPSFIRTTSYTVIGAGAGGTFGFVSAFMFPVFAISVPVYAYHEYKNHNGEGRHSV